MEATIAVATSGPMPGICRSLRHAASLEAIRSTSSFILDDLKLQVLPLAPQHGDQVPHPRGEVLVDVLKHLRQSFPQPNRALGEHDAALQQECTNLVDQSSSARHKPVAHAMESLQVEL